MIHFFLNQQRQSLCSDAPHLSILEWLRTNKELLGTKEGCASGDCGACTVVLVALDDDHASGLNYCAVNACVTPVTALQGKQLLTVEHIALAAKPQLALDDLHPVQRAMVACHGSQCGFCTPGFIMSLYALYMNHISYPGRQAVIEALGGNLCRCTGYQPILNAAEQAYDYPRPAVTDSLREQLEALQQTVLAEPDPQVPQQLADLLAYDAMATTAESAEHSSQQSVKWIAGGTDLSLEFTQQLKSYDRLVDISQVAELNQLIDRDTEIEIGAALSYSKFLPLLLSYYPSVSEVFERLGSLQVRNQASLGGSLANASPIGDPAPLLLALKAKLRLSRWHDGGIVEREVAIADFFTGYRQTVLQPNEVIRSIIIAKPEPHSETFFYKISKRIEDDISAVCLSLHIKLQDNQVVAACCALGGMAATPIVVDVVADALVGQPCSEQSFAAAAEALLAAVNPIDDVRATASYRKAVAANLLRRAWYESNACQQDIVVRVQHA